MEEDKKDLEDDKSNEKLARELEKWQKEYFDLVDEPFRRQNKAEGEIAFVSWENRFKLFLRQNSPSLASEYQVATTHFIKNIYFSMNPHTPHQVWKKNNGEIIEAFLKHAIINARAGRLETVNDNSLHKNQISDKGISMEDIQEIQERRFKFLLTLHQKTHGNTLEPINVFELGQELGYADDETDKIDEHLRAQDLVQGSGGATISITNKGIAEIEATLTKPNERTNSSPANYNIHIEQMTGSQIQQGTSQSSQSLNYSSNDIEAILNFVTELRSKLSELGVDEVTKAEIESDISTIETQIKSPRPKSVIIRESLHSLRTILEGAAGGVLAAWLLQQIPQWLK